ncbi:MAG: hypothetical protein ABL908_16480, partial [Hyphomicrobium sp.]
QFWDQGGFYTPLSAQAGVSGGVVGAAAVAGVAAGGAAAWLARRHQQRHLAEVEALDRSPPAKSKG